jgi:hypothetical protein
MRAPLLLALTLLVATRGAAQSVASRINAVTSGTVRIAFPARPGVCGDGDHSITFHRSDRDEWEGGCQGGPVRVALDRAGGRTVALRAYIGGNWRGTNATDLGSVPAGEASAWLLTLAERNEPASEDAIFPATIAEGVTVWPALLRIARNMDVQKKTRRNAIFWLGQAAGEAATVGLDSITQDQRQDQEVREAAIFALSQRPKDEGVPALIRVAKSNRDPELRKKALFWLGQSEDPAALALFEELLTQP